MTGVLQGLQGTQLSREKKNLEEAINVEPHLHSPEVRIEG